ncbi:hypothetical protein HHI36_001494 [Cryptolaemus montrouzieri]|uniref:Uncharacterized protein n=1 Tax=Cryptolaemus montrouzieri TaxID=559131 RepID=A0ABD2P7T8_9CUCU
MNMLPTITFTFKSRSIIRNEYEDQYKKLEKENNSVNKKLQDIEEEMDLKDEQVENTKVRVQQLKKECIQSEKHLENILAEKAALVEKL